MTEMLSELFKLEEETPERILTSLIEKDENISLKTEIHRPINLARLHAIASWLRQEGLEKSALILFDFIGKYMEYMVSHNRESRKEIIRALSERFKEERKFTEPAIASK